MTLINEETKQERALKHYKDYLKHWDKYEE